MRKTLLNKIIFFYTWTTLVNALTNTDDRRVAIGTFIRFQMKQSASFASRRLARLAEAVGELMPDQQPIVLVTYNRPAPVHF